MKWLANVRIRGIIAGLFLLFSFFVVSYILQMDIPETKRDIVMVLIGAIIGHLNSITGFYFGASHPEDGHVKQNKNNTENEQG